MSTFKKIYYFKMFWHQS